MDNTKNTQNILSVCTGYGGIELGLELAGVDVNPVAYVEIEAFAIANLVAKMEQGKMVSAPVWTNLKTFPARRFRNKIHGIVGGYPCQPFSCAGQRKGKEDPRHLWPYIRKIIKTTRPVWCFFENVEGHVSSGLKEVQGSLRRMGYTVESGIFSAAEVGAPHGRKRIFVLAKSSGFNGSIYTERRNIGREAGYASKELANTESRNSGEPAEPERRQDISRRSEEELANTQKTECTRTQHTRRRRTGFANNSSELAVTCQLGLQGNLHDITEKRRKNERRLAPGRSSDRWPARQGEPQHEWEEPRTIKPGLGRTTHGTSHRVDRLRLLGNGVVRQTVARAWIELWKKQNKE